MSLPTIFDTCRPRADVLAGTIRDDEFMADLSRVVNLKYDAEQEVSMSQNFLLISSKPEASNRRRRHGSTV